MTAPEHATDWLSNRYTRMTFPAESKYSLTIFADSDSFLWGYWQE